MAAANNVYSRATGLSPDWRQTILFCDMSHMSFDHNAEVQSNVMARLPRSCRLPNQVLAPEWGCLLPTVKCHSKNSPSTTRAIYDAAPAIGTQIGLEHKDRQRSRWIERIKRFGRQIPDSQDEPVA